MKPSNVKDKFGEVQSTKSYTAREECRVTCRSPSRYQSCTQGSTCFHCPKEAKNAYEF